MHRVLRKLILPATVAVAAPPLRAQQADARPIEIGVAFGGAAVPDALSSQCGSHVNGDHARPGGELGMSVLRRIGRAVAVQADTRAVVAPILSSGCYLVLPAIDTAYSRSLLTAPLVTSTIRVAVETPRAMPLFRLSAGTGLAWGSSPAPLGVFALAWSTRGEQRRFFAEFERMQTRIHALERNNLSSVPGQQRPIVTHPVAHTFRIGLAWLRK